MDRSPPVHNTENGWREQGGRKERGRVRRKGRKEGEKERREGRGEVITNR